MTLDDLEQQIWRMKHDVMRCNLTPEYLYVGIEVLCTLKTGLKLLCTNPYEDIPKYVLFGMEIKVVYGELYIY